MFFFLIDFFGTIFDGVNGKWIFRVQCASSKNPLITVSV